MPIRIKSDLPGDSNEIEIFKPEEDEYICIEIEVEDGFHSVFLNKESAKYFREIFNSALNKLE